MTTRAIQTAGCSSARYPLKNLVLLSGVLAAVAGCGSKPAAKFTLPAAPAPLPAPEARFKVDSGATTLPARKKVDQVNASGTRP